MHCQRRSLQSSTAIIIPRPRPPCRERRGRGVRARSSLFGSGPRAALVAARAGAALAGCVGLYHTAVAPAVPTHALIAHAGGASVHRAPVRRALLHAGLLHVVGLRRRAGLILGKGGAAHQTKGRGNNDDLLHMKSSFGLQGPTRVPMRGSYVMVWKDS